MYEFKLEIFSISLFKNIIIEEFLSIKKLKINRENNKKKEINVNLIDKLNISLDAREVT